jgi:hypothetical protein
MRLFATPLKGKTLERTVKFGVDKFVNCECIERDVFADPRPLYNQIQRSSVYGPCWHPVNGAGPFQSYAVCFKPFARMPVFWQQVLPKRQSKAREIEITVVGSL